MGSGSFNFARRKTWPPSISRKIAATDRPFGSRILRPNTAVEGDASWRQAGAHGRVPEVSGRYGGGLRTTDRIRSFSLAASR